LYGFLRGDLILGAFFVVVFEAVCDRGFVFTKNLPFVDLMLSIA
jgi:hypothetical protein